MSTGAQRGKASAGRPLLLLDVDGVLCPVRDNTRPGGYYAPAPGFRCERYRHSESGETIEIWVSDENRRRLERLAACFEIVWATGWVQNANRVIAPLHGLDQLACVELVWSEELRGQTASWKLPAIARHVGEERPCVWIDDDLRPDAERWAARRRGPTLLVPVDHRVGLTDEAVEAALAFARTHAAAEPP